MTVIAILFALVLVAVAVTLFAGSAGRNKTSQGDFPNEAPYKLEQETPVEVPVDPVAMTEAEKATIAAEVEETKAELAAVKKTRKPRAAKTGPAQAEK